MSIGDLIPWVIGGIVIISGLRSAAGKAKSGFDSAVDRQRAAAAAAGPDDGATSAVAAIAALRQRLQAAAATSAAPAAPIARGPAPRVPAPPRAPAPPAQRRAPVPAARSVDIPDTAFATPPAAPVSLRRTLADAFGAPASARTAVILAEIVGPPVALR